MNVAMRLGAIALSAIVVGCTPAPTQTGSTGNQNSTTQPSTEVKKTLTGKVTRNGANAKVMLVTMDGDTAEETTAKFFDAPAGRTDADQWPGATVVTPGVDGAYSLDMKLGAKAYTGGLLLCWHDTNNDGKYATNEVAFSAKTGDQLKADFLLSKTDFKEYLGGQQAAVKSEYNWAFNEVKQSVTLKLGDNVTAGGKFALVAVEGNSDAELKTALEASVSTTGDVFLPNVTGFVPTGKTHTLEVKLGDKPYKAVVVVGWKDTNDDNIVNNGELGTKLLVAPAPETGDFSVAFRLAFTDGDALKVMKSDGTLIAGASEYVWSEAAAN